MDNRRGPRLFGALLLIAILLIIGIFVSKLDTNALMGITVKREHGYGHKNRAEA